MKKEDIKFEDLKVGMRIKDNSNNSEGTISKLLLDSEYKNTSEIYIDWDVKPSYYDEFRYFFRIKEGKIDVLDLKDKIDTISNNPKVGDIIIVDSIGHSRHNKYAKIIEIKEEYDGIRYTLFFYEDNLELNWGKSNFDKGFIKISKDFENLLVGDSVLLEKTGSLGKVVGFDFSENKCKIFWSDTTLTYSKDEFYKFRIKKSKEQVVNTKSDSVESILDSKKENSIQYPSVGDFVLVNDPDNLQHGSTLEITKIEESPSGKIFTANNIKNKISFAWNQRYFDEGKFSIRKDFESLKINDIIAYSVNTYGKQYGFIKEVADASIFIKWRGSLSTHYNKKMFYHYGFEKTNINTIDDLVIGTEVRCEFLNHSCNNKKGTISRKIDNNFYVLWEDGYEDFWNFSDLNKNIFIENIPDVESKIEKISDTKNKTFKFEDLKLGMIVRCESTGHYLDKKQGIIITKDSDSIVINWDSGYKNVWYEHEFNKYIFVVDESITLETNGSLPSDVQVESIKANSDSNKPVFSVKNLIPENFKLGSEVSIGINTKGIVSDIQNSYIEVISDGKKNKYNHSLIDNGYIKIVPPIDIEKNSSADPKIIDMPEIKSKDYYYEKKSIVPVIMVGLASLALSKQINSSIDKEIIINRKANEAKNSR